MFCILSVHRDVVCNLNIPIMYLLHMTQAHEILVITRNLWPTLLNVLRFTLDDSVAERLPSLSWCVFYLRNLMEDRAQHGLLLEFVKRRKKIGRLFWRFLPLQILFSKYGDVFRWKSNRKAQVMHIFLYDSENIKYNIGVGNDYLKTHRVALFDVGKEKVDP